MIFKRGDATLLVGEPLRSYITSYQMGEKSAQIKKVVSVFGLDESLRASLMKSKLTDANINEFGRFDKLIASVDRAKTKTYFEKI